MTAGYAVRVKSFSFNRRAKRLIIKLYRTMQENKKQAALGAARKGVIRLTSLSKLLKGRSEQSIINAVGRPIRTPLGAAGEKFAVGEPFGEPIGSAGIMP